MDNKDNFTAEQVELLRGFARKVLGYDDPEISLVMVRDVIHFMYCLMEYGLTREPFYVAEAWRTIRKAGMAPPPALLNAVDELAAANFGDRNEKRRKGREKKHSKYVWIENVLNKYPEKTQALIAEAYEMDSAQLNRELREHANRMRNLDEVSRDALAGKFRQ